MGGKELHGCVHHHVQAHIASRTTKSVVRSSELNDEMKFDGWSERSCESPS
jgi:hypothetical protein